ncbi:MAG: hypothetical protein NC253_10255 [Ruminococcus sp.]|nr:hypothetical protein [Ruminococcus sp.]MCM1381523.1 hypothetical protein [Muribaculaceae bacterium]MCM1479231.1 hypothetical protein [Muribaculaceae bacterium]
MNDKEILNALIDKYVDLQRIITSKDAKGEAEYQLKVIKGKLESMGVVTTDFEIKRED